LREGGLVQALIHREQIITVYLCVSSDYEVRQYATRAGIALFTPSLCICLEGVSGGTPHCFLEIPMH
jgi:hypothetical protein